ncbi:hypothetical protein [Spirosoma endophyticum]|uniref:Uncharacterized protein n=1 Tax=Spirosoma endophyticum TaxID=662367 RepID=A0A1I2GCR0_9BACT|nr:hypothetical protein [Spirosoma endophyticum]SFF14978.1 hypothetical protein SAMN05216167_13121 [Spirosoma endophyticum]
MSNTSEQLDEKLRQEGYTPSSNPNRYDKVDERGIVTPVWTSGDHYQEQGSSTWTKKD